jgi:hypothetical protein
MSEESRPARRLPDDHPAAENTGAGGGIDVLNDVRAFIGRFVVLGDAQADAVTLWAAHTHVIEAFNCTPYLAITSGEKRSGKSRLLEVVELLVREPLQAVNISDAALFRVVGHPEKSPTLLLDEVDAIFKAREREELRGLLNAGYRRGAVAYRMGGTNNRTLESFPVFCPKAFAGIGNCLPDTIADRSIPIRLQRRLRDEHIERFTLRDVEPEGGRLADRLCSWVEPQYDYLAEQRPDLPDELDDRAQDVWEPLLAIADLAGWGERARTAAVNLSTGAEREDESTTALLLRDIYSYFTSNGHDRTRTADLLDYLHAVEESPWGEWYGKPLSAHSLSKLLRAHRIKTMPVRVDGETVRGYKVEQFGEAFARVLGVTGVTGVTSRSTGQAGSNASNARNAYPSNGRVPAFGDVDYLDYVLACVAADHITTGEALGLERIHRLIAEHGERGRGATHP